MIIQTAPIGQHRLAIMMYEHTALSHQFARSFGNKRFQGPEPNDLMFNVVLHHDAGWAEFARLLGYKQAYRWYPSSRLCPQCGATNGDLTLAECLRSIELFSAEVMPGLRATDMVRGEQTAGVAAHGRR